MLLEFLFDEAARTPVWYDDAGSEALLATSSSTLVISIDDDGLPTKDDTITINATAGGKQYKTSYKVAVTDLLLSDLLANIVKEANGDANFGNIKVAVDPKNENTLDFTGVTSVSGSSAPNGGTITYYPGSNTNRPSLLAVQPNPSKLLVKIDAGGCGMTRLKAQVMNALAQGFASGASSATGTAVGTLGGIDIGLLVLGKINIGDNKALTSAIEAIVSEIVARLTIEATYPVLIRLDPPGASHNSLTATFVTAKGS